MKKAFLLCTILTAATVQTKILHNKIMPAKPKTSLKTSLLTAGAGAVTATGVMYGLDALFTAFGVERVPFAYSLGTGFNIGPVQIRTMLRNTFSTPANYVIAGSGITLGCLAAWLMYRCQPEGKFNRSYDVINKAVCDEILNQLLQTSRSLIAEIDETYIHASYPRVAAYNAFIEYHQNLLEARKMLEEAARAANDSEFQAAATDCLLIIDTYIENIKNCIAIIRNQSDWIEQLKGYDAMLARQAQERAAIATQQIAWNGLMPQHHYHYNA